MKSILCFLSLYLHFTLKSQEALYSGILCIFSNKFKLFDDGNVSKQFHLSFHLLVAKCLQAMENRRTYL